MRAYIDEHGAVYDKLASEHDKGFDRVDVLSRKISAWERYKGYKAVYDKSHSLKGIAKWKFDMENRATLDAFPGEIERLRKVIPECEKIKPNAWRKEIERIVDGQERSERPQRKHSYLER